MVISQYYAFTSLSTVGFGDFHPKSNFERIICSVILLFGVMIFSYIIGVFNKMVDDFKSMQAENENEYKLFNFFEIMKKFNNGKNMPEEFMTKMH